MLQKLALAVLLPAMLLNGLWVVCPPQDGAESPVSSKESADCIRICAALEASLGTICLLFPGHSNASITVIDYGSAVLPDAMLVQPVDIDQQFETALPVSYGNPFLPNPTPPPEA
jgi:hypothetical protein